MPLIKTKESINFNVSKIVAAIATHVHFDHLGYIEQYLKAGIKVYANHPTIKHHNLLPITPKWKVGDWTIVSFPVKHNVECYGFLINHPSCGNFTFITDCQYVPVKFSGLNQIIVECNYQEEILQENVINGKVNSFVGNRVLDVHMSLATVREFILANDISKVRNIVLIHLSSDNSDALAFKKEIESITGKSVWIADKGMQIDFNINPF